MTGQLCEINFEVGEVFAAHSAALVELCEGLADLLGIDGSIAGAEYSDESKTVFSGAELALFWHRAPMLATARYSPTRATLSIFISVVLPGRLPFGRVAGFVSGRLGGMVRRAGFTACER